MSSMSASQFAWTCCDAGDYPPPIPKRGARYGADAACYLCGGDTRGVGWHRKDALGLSFTDVAQAAQLNSATVCQECAATTQASGWVQYVTAHPERGLKPHFDAKEGKAPRAWNWLYSNHLFVGPGYHECPDRARWREILADPPAPPFLMVIAPMGKKQLIFKSRVGYDRDAFPVQMDDESIWIRPPAFRAALADFMTLYLLGFSKDSILIGEYHPAALMTVGADRWRAAEEPARRWRRGDPLLWSVCHYLAQRPDGWEAPQRTTPLIAMPTPILAPPVPVPPPQGQVTLF